MLSQSTNPARRAHIRTRSDVFRSNSEALSCLWAKVYRVAKSLATRGSPQRLEYLEPHSKSFEEDDEAGKLDKAEEIVGVVLPANEDPALPLNPGEEALDEPASHVAA